MTFACADDTNMNYDLSLNVNSNTVNLLPSYKLLLKMLFSSLKPPELTLHSNNILNVIIWRKKIDKPNFEFWQKVIQKLQLLTFWLILIPHKVVHVVVQ